MGQRAGGFALSGWTVPGYTETGVLGSGATGRVVAAVQDATRTEVAIKYLNPRLLRNPEFVARFRDEAALLAEIEHPNVVRLHELVEADEGSAMVMELVPGPTLHRLLHESGPMSPEAALSVMRGSLLGLGAAHQVGIVHRDYKPSNVLLNAYGVSKLADFGVAERAEPSGEGEEEDPDATSPAGVGTPSYMAPEQWDGAPAQPVTDIYAVTASFFECLTGKVPFAADTVYELQEKHRTAPVPLDQVPEGVKELVAHGLAKDPAERPQDVWAFVAEVERSAAEAYGVEWEERGRQDIVVMLWPLLALMGLGGGGAGGPGGGGLDMLGLGPGDPGQPGQLSAPTGSGSEGAEPEDAEAEGGEGHHTPYRPDNVKLGAVVAGVLAIILIIAAVAVAGSSKSPRQTAPGAISMVFTPTAGAPTGTPTGSGSGAATTTTSSSSPSSSSSSSGSSSSSSSSSSPSSRSSSSPSTQPPSTLSSSPVVVPPPTLPPTSSPASTPSSPASTPAPTTSSAAPIPISAQISAKPGNCVVYYDVVFTAGKAPGGSVTFDFTWHLLNGQTASGGPVTLTPGSSQSASTAQNTGSASGEVYATWVADGVAGRSRPVSVNVTCLT